MIARPWRRKPAPAASFTSRPAGLAEQQAWLTMLGAEWECMYGSAEAALASARRDLDGIQLAALTGRFPLIDAEKGPVL